WHVGHGFGAGAAAVLFHQAFRHWPGFGAGARNRGSARRPHRTGQPRRWWFEGDGVVACGARVTFACFARASPAAARRPLPAEEGEYGAACPPPSTGRAERLRPTGSAVNGDSRPEG